MPFIGVLATERDETTARWRMSDIGHFRTVYCTLAALRVAFAFSPGYVHPDEFFQSAEVAACEIAGLRTALIPWEFSAVHPVRSRLPPYLFPGLALRVLQLFVDAPSTWVLLFTVRLPSCAISFLVDAAIARIGRTHSLPVTRLLLLYASAWPTLVFGARGFSNSLEASLFAVVLAMVAVPSSSETSGSGSDGGADGGGSDAERHPRRIVSTARRLGVLLAIGCWLRFTFVLFWLPPFVSFALGDLQPSVATVPAAQPRTRQLLVRSVARVVMPAASAAVIAAAMLLSTDCLLHGGECLMAPWKCVAPFNALRYNADPINLAAHTLHPRITHVFVNLPLLMGPLAAIAAAATAAAATAAAPAAAAATASAAKLAPKPSSNPSRAPCASFRRLLLSSVLLPLGALSLAPHQEPRFLLPLILPLILLYGPALQGRSSMLGWVCYHAALALFYSNVHQAGVVRAIAHLQRASALPQRRLSKRDLHQRPTAQLAAPRWYRWRWSGSPFPPAMPPQRADATDSTDSTRGTTDPTDPALAVFFHTYMPPEFLLGRSRAQPAAMELLDLASNSTTCELIRALVLACGTSRGRADQVARPTTRGVGRRAFEWGQLARGRQPSRRWHAGPLYAVLPARLAYDVKLAAASTCRPAACACASASARTSGIWERLPLRFLRPRRAALLRLDRERRFWPHFSGEDPPRSLSEAALEVYRVTLHV